MTITYADFEKVDIRVGPASDSLAAMTGEAAFDFIFIDADKQSNAHYVAEAIRLGRPGTTIIVDNAKARGRTVLIESAVLERSITDSIISFRLLSSSFALFGVRRFIAALEFFDLAPIIRYPM